MARTKQKPKVKGRFSKDKMRGVVKAKNRRTAAQAQAQAQAQSRSTSKTGLPPKGKTRQKASSHEAETLNKWKKPCKKLWKSTEPLDFLVAPL